MTELCLTVLLGLLGSSRSTVKVVIDAGSKRLDGSKMCEIMKDATLTRKIMVICLQIYLSLRTGFWPKTKWGKTSSVSTVVYSQGNTSNNIVNLNIVLDHNYDCNI